MSAQDPTSLTDWWQNLPVPWLVGDAISRADATAQGTVLDQQVALIKLSTKAHFPDYAPTDALPHIGGDRQLEQGPIETNANFVVRLKTAWDDWARAGTAVELLTQLYWTGFPGAVLVQQNGLMYSLSGAPTAGVDPTSLLVVGVAGGNAIMGAYPPSAISINISTGGPLGTMQFDAAMGAYSIPTTLTNASPLQAYFFPGTNTALTFTQKSYSALWGYTISTAGVVAAFGGATLPGPSQQTNPWWTFDGYDKHTSRFAVLFPNGGGIFTTTGTATFTGVEDGSALHPWPTVVWNNVFPDTTYHVQVGVPTVTDGSGPVVCAADGTTKTTTGVQVEASAPFTGTVTVLAWQNGANPFADPHPNDLARLARIINRWRPAKALCMGVWEFIRSPWILGYPTSTVLGQVGLVLGTGSSAWFGV